mmetsp:Transcript_52461/g.152676  ORF Transcript_52461/g.152676 Transcript_52461/m.152676 type:complete len:88 (-) Transcript_52461:61-324(-)
MTGADTCHAELVHVGICSGSALVCAARGLESLHNDCACDGIFALFRRSTTATGRAQTSFAAEGITANPVSKSALCRPPVIHVWRERD